jgi:hypothetical protein
VNVDEVGWFEIIFKWLVGIVGFLLAGWSGWLMNSIAANRREIGAVKDLVTKHELEDARTYVSRQDFKETVLDLRETSKRIFGLVDQINNTLLNMSKDK